jgi:hypothetical protein
MNPSSPSLSSLTTSPDEVQLLLPDTLVKGQYDARKQLRRATYVKVVDLANLNNLDVDKIRLETIKHTQANEQQEVKETESLKPTMEEASFNDDTSTSSHFTEEFNKELTKVDDESIPSTDGHKESRLFKKMVPCPGGFNLCL